MAEGGQGQAADSLEPLLAVLLAGMLVSVLAGAAGVAGALVDGVVEDPPSAEAAAAPVFVSVEDSLEPDPVVDPDVLRESLR